MANLHVPSRSHRAAHTDRKTGGTAIGRHHGADGKYGRGVVMDNVSIRQLRYGRLIHTGIILVIMAMSLMVWHNVESYAEEKLDINTANKAELDGLPGIGDVLSQRIIAYREQHGCFLDIYEVKNVKDIGTKRFDRIKDLIAVNILPAPRNPRLIDCEAAKNRVRESVEKIWEEMNGPEKGRTTFAVAEVYVWCSPLAGRIETWVSNAGQGHNIREGIVAAAGPNAEEVAYPDDFGDGMGNHAEMGLLRKAQMDQVRIMSIWATREICEDCENNLRKAGFNDDFVNRLCYVESKVRPKGKLAAMWSEIKNSIYRNI